MSEINRVVLQSFGTRFEAESIKILLEANGVAATVSADDAGGAYPHLLIGVGGANVMVQEEDLERAKQILADIALDESIDESFEDFGEMDESVS